MLESIFSAPRVKKITEEAVHEIAYEANRIWVRRMMKALGVGPRELCRLMGKNPETCRVRLHEILAGKGSRSIPMMEEASVALIKRAEETKRELEETKRELEKLREG